MGKSKYCLEQLEFVLDCRDKRSSWKRLITLTLLHNYVGINGIGKLPSYLVTGEHFIEGQIVVPCLDTSYTV